MTKEWYASGILKLLEVLLSSDREVKEKKEILQNDFSIEMTKTLESLTIKSQVWKWNILNELQKCISDIFVHWKLHDKKSVVTGTQLGDVYRKELSNEVVWLFWFLHCVNGSD